MVGGPSKDPSKLTTAAEELIKAACSHAESAIDNETAEGLKKLSSKTILVQKSVESFENIFGFQDENPQPIGLLGER